MEHEFNDETPLCHWQGNRQIGAVTRGVLLGILGRGVPPGSPNPDPISDQNLTEYHFLHPKKKSIPVFRHFFVA